MQNIMNVFLLILFSPSTLTVLKVELLKIRVCGETESLYRLLLTVIQFDLKGCFPLSLCPCKLKLFFTVLYVCR